MVKYTTTKSLVAYSDCEEGFLILNQYAICGKSMSAASVGGITICGMC